MFCVIITKISLLERPLMKKQYLYAFGAIGFWATTATVSKLLLHSYTTMQVLALTSAIAAVFLLVVNGCKGNLKQLRTYRMRDFLLTSCVGLLGTFGYDALLYMGIDRLMASQAMIINYLWPMMAVAADCVLMKEKMTVRKIIAVVMSFTGVIIVTSNGSLGGFGGSSLAGALCCVLAAVSYGLFVALNKRLSYDPMVNMMLYYAQSAILAFAVVLFRGGMPIINGTEFLGFLWIGVGCHAIGYVSWALAMKYGDTAKVANIAYITPFLAMVVAHFVLGDPITLWSAGGLAVIVAGIFLQLKDK